MSHAKALTFAGLVLLQFQMVSGAATNACTKGMEIEQGFSKALTATTKFKVNGSELELSGAEGLLAKFRAGAK